MKLKILITVILLGFTLILFFPMELTRNWLTISFVACIWLSFISIVWQEEIETVIGRLGNSKDENS